MINLLIYQEKIQLQNIKKENLLKKIMIKKYYKIQKKTLKTLLNMHVLVAKHYVLDFKFILCQNYI
jgi:hypothetical protein